METRQLFVVLCVFTELAAVAMAQNLSVLPFQIERAKVTHEADAKRIAFEHYIKKMKTRVLAEEGVQKISVFKLGHDVIRSIHGLNWVISK